jgi:hypothetical protein
MSTPYQLVFMPYLALGGIDRIRVGDVEIWNFDKLASEVADETLRARVEALLSMYRQTGRKPGTSSPLRDIGIVSIGKQGFSELSFAEFEQVQEARYLLFLCCLAKNCTQYGPNAGHAMFTSENFEVVYQSFLLDSDFVSERAGVLVTIQILGYKIGETRFTKPSYVNLPIRFAYDDKLLDALVALKTDQPVLYQRILRSAAVFLESYYNSPSVDMKARILLQTVALEVLLDLPDTGQRKQLKNEIEALTSIPGEKTYTYHYEVPNAMKEETRNLKVMWADRFYTLRNHIIHGQEVHPRDFRFLRCQHHLLIAPVMFTFAVKRLVDTANARAGNPRRFFERIDWGVIEKGDEYDPPRIGFRINTDFMAMVQSLPEQEEP